MTVSNHQNSSSLAAFILLVGAAVWSAMRVISSIVLSIIGNLLVIYSACHALSLRQTTQETEIKYNLVNYPDEVYIASKS
jgi:uncharacterized membrane protein